MPASELSFWATLAPGGVPLSVVTDDEPPKVTAPPGLIVVPLVDGSVLVTLRLPLRSTVPFAVSGAAGGVAKPEMVLKICETVAVPSGEPELSVYPVAVTLTALVTQLVALATQ